MEEKETITVISSTNNEIVRESNEFVFANTGLSEIQMNMFCRGITKFDIDPEKIDIERRYLVEFQRSEIPRIDRTNKIIEELEALQDIRVKRVLPDGGWERLIPFPKIGKYEDGSIKIWFDGEYLKPILERKEGYAVFHIAEMFSLNGGHPKRLFEMFSSYKNRNVKRFDIEIPVLKNILGVPDKYKDNPGMFMKKVVFPAIEQISEKTSISVKAAYERRKGRTPARIIFDVERKEQVKEGLTEPKEQPSPRTPETGFTDKQKSCIDWLLATGFTKNQAYNCAMNEATINLYFSWKYHNTIDAELTKGSIDRKTAQKMFFGELKKNGLKI
jgi:plasmid replication initiation protein